MNKQGPGRISWTDWTWNPVTGCKHDRSYCYARGRYHQYGWSFEPTFHPEKLEEPRHKKAPAKIFVCSTADLFGDWVPREWIEAVLNRVQRADYAHHNYQFLTKNPKRLAEFNPWPKNCWVGTTVTNQKDADERGHLLRQVEASVRFISHEPLLGNIILPGPPYWYQATMDGVEPWAIIGAMTGHGEKYLPMTAWVEDLVNQYRAAGVPLFLKENLQSHYPSRHWQLPIIQEWPK